MHLFLNTFYFDDGINFNKINFTITPDAQHHIFIRMCLVHLFVLDFENLATHDMSYYYIPCMNGTPK